MITKWCKLLSYERREKEAISEKAHTIEMFLVNQFIKDCVFVDEKNGDSSTIEQDASKM